MGGEGAADTAQIKIGERAYVLGQDCPHGEYDLSFEFAGDGAEAVEALFGYRDARNFYALSASPGRISLGQRVAGESRTLAAEPGVTFHQLVIQRRRQRLSVLCDGRQVLSCEDERFHAGKVAIASEPPSRPVNKFSYQPVSDIYFTDDFMRASDQDSVWIPVAGEWVVTSTIDQARGGSIFQSANWTRSANPFVFAGSGEQGALAVTGNDFWDEYRFGVSVRGSGTVGCVFFYQDKEHYYGLQWSLTSVFSRRGPLELFAQRGDRRETMAKTELAGSTNQWYRLEVYAGPRRIRVWVDGTTVLDVPHQAYHRGKVGLHVAKDTRALFDDVLVETPVGWELDRKGWLALGRSIRGEWRIAEDEAGDAGLRCESDEEALYLLEGKRWRANCLTAECTAAGTAGSLGLIFDWRRPDSFCLARLHGDGRLVLAEVRDAKQRVLASASGARLDPGRHRLAVDAGEPNLVKLYVDGVLELRAPINRPVEGAGGVYAAAAKGALFRDIRWAPSLTEGTEHFVSNQIFTDDLYMLEWSAPQGAWVPGPGPEGAPAFWHKGDFHGSFELSLPLTEPVPGSAERRQPLSSPCRVCFRADRTDWDRGYVLEVAPLARKGSLSLRLCRQGEAIASARIEAAVSKLVLISDGKYIVCRAGGQDRLAHRDGRPLRGTRLGLAVGAAPRFDEIRLRRDHVVDDLFTKAPVHWDTVGRWEVTNKFACDPRWSYLAGESEGLAAVWHRGLYTGDLTLEYYAGMRYRQSLNWMPHYARPGDMNAVVCGDGVEVFSGYTFVLAGWDTTWTRILKNGRVVAETDKPLVPSTRFSYPPLPKLHRRWFYVKIRKQGGRLEYYLDNELVLTYEDPEPLSGGQVGLWTQDNSIMVARVKIEYQKKVRSALTGRAAVAAADPSAPHVTLESATHPGFLSTFEQGLDGWRNPSGDQGANLNCVPREAGRGRCLRLSNVNSGGDFAAQAPVSNLDLSKGARLTFGYRIPTGVCVNVYLKLSGKWLFVRFTGSTLANENLKCLGEFSDVRTDDRWHRATFDLCSAVRASYPAKATIAVESLIFGNPHKGYLLAGYGGNRAGVRYFLDNVAIVSTSGGRLEAAFSVPDVTGAKFASAISDRPEFALPEQPLSDQAQWSKDGVADGRWYLHVRAKLPDGTWTDLSGLPFRVSGRPVRVTRIRPREGKGWGGHPVSIELSSDRAIESVALTVGDRAVDLSSNSLRLDGRTHTLTFHPRGTGLEFTDGQQIPVKLRIGEVEKQWHYEWRLKDDKFPPSLVAVDQLLANDTFENGLGEWTRHGGKHSAWLIRSDESPASGSYSLKCFNEVIGGIFGAMARGKPFEVGPYPLLRFKYRVPPDVLVDLGVATVGGWKRIILTDNNHRNAQYRLGRVPNAVADGQWHQAEVDLYELLSNQPFHGKMYTVNQLAFGDWGWQGNREGDVYWIDDFQIVPVLSRHKGLRLSWRAEDNSGLAAYSYHWSRAAAEEADAKPESHAASASFEDVPEGHAYFHIRAQDKAGNWGPSATYKFLVDNTPTSIRSVGPAPGARSGDGRIVVQLDRGDGAGIDPASLALTIDGKKLTPGQGGLTYAPSAQQLVWDWLHARADAEAAIPNGKKLQVALAPVSDFAGNRSKPLSWEWTMDYARDKRAPAAPQIRLPSEVALCHEAFSRDLGGCRPYGGGMAVKRVVDEVRQDYCAQITQDMDGGMSSAYLWSQPYDLARYPHVAFDYRFPEKLGANLLVCVNSTQAVVGLTDADVRRRYTKIGSVEDVTRDNQWHHVSINLLDMVRENLPEAATYQVKWIAIGHWSWRGWNPEGTTYWVDNVTVSGVGRGPAAAEFESHDASGIRGYAYVLDQQPSSVPKERVNCGGRVQVPALRRGEWYLHVRACDGGGNWSATAHCPFFQK